MTGAVQGRVVGDHTMRDHAAQGRIAHRSVTGGAIDISGMDLVDSYPARVPNPRRAHRADLS
ncbi:hypothetical protein AB0N88_18015 [Streptomyces sp. NPDC093516]|uniref:hypothetical protein n=1 Tax=Streptomyces sp. NPDC093516 TaxID=3155304 RepID=UPI003426272F